jgi:predicted aminopeptidase
METKTRYWRSAKITSVFVVFVLFLLTIIFSANVTYLIQAISGHIRIMSSRASIENILKTYHPYDKTQNTLRMVLQVREFAAKKLGLPDNKSYTVISDIKGKYPGWNVYCSPKLSVEPKKWCYPVAGSVVYRGYFSKANAQTFKGEMEKKGFDVYVGPFNAYSTLGWFDDPLLSSHLLFDTIQLAGIIIHELAHQKVYISDDSRLNEGFAVSVERAGVVRWLKSIGRDDQILQALRIWKAEDTIAAKILFVRTQLSYIYHSGADSMSKLQKKDSILQNLKNSLCHGNCNGIKLPGTDGEDFDFNNAFLTPINIYYSLVPAFQNIFESCGGDFPKFYGKVKEIGELPYEIRQHKFDSLYRL